MEFLPEKIWLPREKSHHQRLHRRLASYLEDRQANRKHPIRDFLFDYYSFRPSHLLRWSPGPEVGLEGSSARKFLARKEFQLSSEPNSYVFLNPALISEQRWESLRWIHSLLQITAQRPPQFGCFGLHEWAMVYQSERVRHPQQPLRLSPEKIAMTLEEAKVRCSHFDAFRFFTPPARPLNQWQPVADSRLDLEQRGCLHVNMDLYKWAYKLHPWIESELLADCFFLAWDIREIDMRASPYDFSTEGFPAIPIETAAGRTEYEKHQFALAERAEPLRQKLLHAYAKVLKWSGVGGVRTTQMD